MLYLQRSKNCVGVEEINKKSVINLLPNFEVRKKENYIAFKHSSQFKKDVAKTEKEMGRSCPW